VAGRFDDGLKEAPDAVRELAGRENHGWGTLELVHEHFVAFSRIAWMGNDDGPVCVSSPFLLPKLMPLERYDIGGDSNCQQSPTGRDKRH
jgi:hypothetical protein